MTTSIERSFTDDMMSLVHSFPCLRGFPGSWDPLAFQAWGAAKSSGEKHAIRFVLSVWNPTTRWKIGRFDLHEALGVWDSGNRAAFVAWAEEPWWP